jgi:PPOX class probable FMN-dependent enzyme
MPIVPKVIFKTEAALRAFIDKPIDLAIAKAIKNLDHYCIGFIARSPFLCIGTNSGHRADVSPRGDKPGFVQVLDENTIFIPERPGNNRIDTLTNIIENPSVGVFFMIPGYEECLRVTGQASIVGDEELLEAATVNGKIPKLGILIHVEEAMLHCAKAVRRCKLWDPASLQDRSQMPTLGKMILEQTSTADNPPSQTLVEEVDNYVEHTNTNELY